MSLEYCRLLPALLQQLSSGTPAYSDGLFIPEIEQPMA